MYILIVGATGVLGKETTRQLLAAGHKVRAMTRDLQRGAVLSEMGAEVVQGDLIDAASLQKACQGVDAVLAAAHQLMGTGKYASEAVDDAGHRSLIDAAKAAGVKHFVYTSAQNASVNHPTDFYRTKAKVEAYLKASGLSYTILRPPPFMEWHVHNLLGASILTTGKTTIYGAGNNPINFVAGSDVARFAVLGLTDPRLIKLVMKGEKPIGFLIAYPNVHSNNADLPAEASVLHSMPRSVSDPGASGSVLPFAEVFSGYQILIAMTEFSATAPLKLHARHYGFRAATMPGFSAAMIPALRLDYEEINRRVWRLKNLLDEASFLRIEFRAGGKEMTLGLDLSHRTAHASGGRFPDPGTAGNLPSGEAYIVPYEGEKGEDSRTRGELPVEISGEVLVFAVEANKALAVRPAATLGPAWKDEAERLRLEPAYGNMAELGFGVLGDFGIGPVGEILLDEKLGLHVAFGRSDHFGGQVGPAAFSRPEAVIHLDRIYIPAEDLARFDVTESDLFAKKHSDGVRALVEFEARRADAAKRGQLPELLGTRVRRLVLPVVDRLGADPEEHAEVGGG